MCCTNAVGASITTTNHQYIFAFGSDALVLGELDASEDAVLLREQFEGEVYTFQFAARSFEISGGGSASRDDNGIELLCKLL